MVAAVMAVAWAVVHMAVPPPLPSRAFVLVLVLVLGDSAIGGANGAPGHDEQALCGAEASVPEFSVVFRFRAYS